MRTLYRIAGHRLARQMPELVTLFGGDDLRRRFRAPFRLEAMVDEFPQLAYAAATI